MKTRFRLPLPVLTRAEKTALLTLTLILGSGAALRAWEKSGVEIGPVHDLESLRNLVIDARQSTGDSVFPCAAEPPDFSRANRWPEREPDTVAAAATPENPHAPNRSGKKAPTSVLDLNAATTTELEGLPGIGPATAKAMVARRSARHGFRKVDDLLEVKGIGPKKLAALRPWVELKAPGNGLETGKKVLEP